MTTPDLTTGPQRSVRRLSRAFRAFLESDRNRALVEPFGGWGDGGDLILADAVVMWLAAPPPHVEPVVLAEIPELRVVFRHALVSVGRWLVDADGVSSRPTLKRRWREVEGLVVPIVLADPDRQIALQIDGIYRDARTSVRLAERLRRRFPHARDTLLA